MAVAVAAKAMQVLAIIKRNFVMQDEEDFQLSTCRIRVQVWSPYLKKDTECLEKVQRRATKLVKGLKQNHMQKDWLECILCHLRKTE